MSNTVKWLRNATFLLLISFASFAYAQTPVGTATPAPQAQPINPGNALDQISHKINWENNGINAAIFIIVLGALRALEMFLAAKGIAFFGGKSKAEKESNDAVTQAMKDKLDKLIEEVKELSCFCQGDVGVMIHSILKALEELSADLSRHNTVAEKMQVSIGTLDDKIVKISSLVDQLEQMTSKTDSDGMPLIYVPRSWHETQRDIMAMLTQLATNQRDLIEIVRNMKK